MSEEQKPKKKKKGFIVFLSIFGGVVVLILGVMAFALISMQQKATTAKIQGKTFAEVDNKVALKVVDSSSKDVDDESRQKILNFVESESLHDSTAAQIQEEIVDYSEEDLAKKFDGTKFVATKTSMFNYTDLSLKFYGSDNKEYASYDLQENGNHNLLEYKDRSAKLKQDAELTSYFGIKVGLGYSNSIINGEDGDPELYITHSIADQVKFNGENYRIFFRVTYTIG